MLANKQVKNQLIFLSAVLAVVVAGISFSVVTPAQAETNPFCAEKLSHGYSTQLSHEADEGKCGEGKCGEGKCGNGKCGEGKCGEGKCGGSSS